MTQDERQGHERRKRVAVHTFRHIATENSKACSVHFEPGVHHLRICTLRAQESMVRKVAAAKSKHADCQHRASQRCVFIAPEDRHLKRILNASPPVQPATSRALGTLHDESDSKPAEAHPYTHCPTSSVRSGICSPTNETLPWHELCARQARRSR